MNTLDSKYTYIHDGIDGMSEVYMKYTYIHDGIDGMSLMSLIFF
jgi:hypothetical protein